MTGAAAPPRLAPTDDSSSAAATAAQKMPNKLPMMVFLRASVSPPLWKKQAQAMKPAQMAMPVFK